MSEESLDRGDGVRVGPIPAWRPLLHPMFRALWIASFVSNLGSWMREVGAAWMMASMKPEPFMVSLIPAAGNLALCLLALPAGALADVFDRRRLLMVTHIYMALVAGTLAGLTSQGLVGPATLVEFIFLLAIGNALTFPAWQSIYPEMVPKEQVPAALALGGVGFNLSRIIGPAAGGYVFAHAGPAAVFGVNAVSFLAVVAVLLFWRRKPVHRHLPEPVLPAIRTGFRYVRHSPGLRAVLARSAGMILFGSAFWAMVPLYARDILGLSSGGYGVLLGWFGLGAVAGGLSLSWCRHRASTNTIVTIASIGTGIHLLLLAALRLPAAVDAAMIFGGLVWSIIMLSLNITVLHQAPDWVRSRAAAIYLLVFTGTQSLGSVLWGALAERVGIPYAFLAAGAALVVTSPVLTVFALHDGEDLDHTPARHWPPHDGNDEPEHHEGPVLVVIQYLIAGEQAEQFRAVMSELRLTRLRNGATRWDLFQDTTAPERWFESFLVSSWVEHLRQHDRMTVTDQILEERAVKFHRGPDAPRMQHFLTRG